MTYPAKKELRFTGFESAAAHWYYIEKNSSDTYVE